MPRFPLYLLCFLRTSFAIRRRKTTAVVLAGLGTLSPAATLPDGCKMIPLTSRNSPAKDQSFLLRSPAETGIDFRHTWNPPEKYAPQSDGAFAGGGVAIGDIDGDGKPDVYLSRPTGGGQLYRNLGAWKFENVTAKAGLAADAGHWGLGCTMADIDNDGDLDLSVCGYDTPVRLFFNDGHGVFTEAAASCGMNFTGAGVVLTWADYDVDGDLDAYLVTNRWNRSESLSAQNRAQLAALEKRLIRNAGTGRYSLPEDLREDYDIVHRADGKPNLVNSGQADRLFRNEGPGARGLPQFKDVTREAGVWDNGRGNAAIWWDYNADGRPDLYVANDFYGPDRLWHNNGDGTFTDKAPELLPHTPWFSMGCDAGDLNNDGRLDLIASDMSGSTHYKDKMGMGDMDQSGWFLEVGMPRQYMRNAVFLNSGGGHPFMEMAHLAGMSGTDWTWAVKLADLDCDGWLDVYVTNGMTGDFLNSDLRAESGPNTGTLKNAPRKNDPKMAFRNRGDLTFESVGKAWGLERESVSFGAAWGDLDLDGDMDLVVNNFDEPCSVYENAGSGGGCVTIRLTGTQSNRGGLGALLTAEAADLKMTRSLTSARGFASSDEPVAHFGLGSREKIDRLTIHWPGGRREYYQDLPTGHRYDLREGAGPEASPPAKPAAPMFSRAASLEAARHRERPFDDFARQPLLPNKLSQAGPALAWGDMDGDGDVDLFQGGAAGAAGTLWTNNGAGGFQKRECPALEKDRECEDMGALFLDADADGDEDLFVVSGGVECDAGSPLLQDRLYLNDGAAGFTRAPLDSLPRETDSGSAACAADFDRDGDLDLFVGGRVIPGQYPLSPGSRLLRNDRGKFSDVTSTAAPELSDPRKAGLVTGATWTDADGDGWQDLLIAAEWGAVRVFRNDHGALRDVSTAAGTASPALHGWWTGVFAADLDGDGDPDFLATNFGLNTKYHPAPGRPARLYYGDFDGLGEPQVIEAKTTSDGVLLPVRGKSCSQQAIPSLRLKFPTFHSFASSTLQAIYPEELLEKSHRCEAETLHSGIFWNETTPGGPLTFVFDPLPRLAQLAPAFGSMVTDVNLDGLADIYLVQNSWSPQRETGRIDGGVSLLLTGRGNRQFEPAWPEASGLVIAADAKSLTVCDLNGDGRPDFVAGINDRAPAVFENRTTGSSRPLTVKLHGLSGNLAAAGARITLRTTSGRTSTADVHAGSGCLSQSALGAFFALKDGEEVSSIDVVWPDGTRSGRRGAVTGPSLIIAQQPAVKSR